MRVNNFRAEEAIWLKIKIVQLVMTEIKICDQKLKTVQIKDGGGSHFEFADMLIISGWMNRCG
jgi:hypothetical protein